MIVLSDPARLAALTALALSVATEAAALVRAGFRSRPAADRKGRCDLVTAYDVAAERLVAARLGAATPDIPVVGEELGRQGCGGSDAEQSWFVDPLDGTTNFVHGHPFWCVAVGLMDGAAPVVGAVVAPSLDLAWTGHRGGPATRNGEPCHVSSTEKLEDALVATGFPPVRDHAPENNLDSFQRVTRASQAVRRCGSAAIDMCMVADGTFDAYWERRLYAWDTVAAAAVVLAAGGRITSLSGAEPTYGRGYLAVSNARVHEALLGAIGAPGR